MLLMQDKKKRGKGRPHKNPDTPPGERSKVQLSGRVDPKIRGRFMAFIECHKRKTGLETGIGTHLEKAVREYLDREEPLFGCQE